MCDRALEREELRRELCCDRVLSASGCGLETEVVVSVRELCGAGRVHDVYLGGEAVAGAEPGGADEGEPGVGVVFYERGGVEGAVLVEGVPDAGVGGEGGEVVAFLEGLRFGGDYGVVDCVDFLDHAVVGVHVL